MLARMPDALLRSPGGSIVEESEGLFDCRYTGRFVTFLLGLGAFAFGGASLLISVLAVVRRVAFASILPVIPGFVATALFLALIRFRRMRMGRCIVDRGAGLLRRLRGEREIERWPLAAVRFGVHWDPFHRGFTLQYWLTVRVPDGRALRLGKGPREDVERALRRMLSAHGLPIAGSRQ